MAATYNTTTYTCDGCDKKVSIDVRAVKNSILCKDCFDTHTVQCKHCGNVHLFNDYQIDLHLIEEVPQWVCNSCWNRMNRAMQHRDYSTTVHGKGMGSMVPSERGWSCEIECYLTSTVNAGTQFSKLPNTFGIGRDGSLTNAGQATSDGRVLTTGIEIATPILVGLSGEEYLRNLCKALNHKDNARVDSTCGLHLRVDMRDCYQNVETIKRLMIFHWMYEPVIMSFLPANRRANIYCQSLKNDYHYKKIMAAKDYNELYRIWYKDREELNRYDKKHPRYHGINLHSLFQGGSVEVRYHSGTTNSKKIMFWAALHARIIDFCHKDGFDMEKLITESITMTGRPRSLSKLTSNMFAALKLPPEHIEYFLNRQRKFKNAKQTMEIDFIEKDAVEPLPNQEKIAEQGFDELKERIQKLQKEKAPDDEYVARFQPIQFTTRPTAVRNGWVITDHILTPGQVTHDVAGERIIPDTTPVNDEIIALLENGEL